MSIRSTSVSRCLEKKIMVMGFEIPDLLAIFLSLSVLNFLFGSTDLKIPLVWVPAASLAIVLRFVKRGKPENYLIHWLRYQLQPGVISAFPDPSHYKFRKLPKKD